MDLNHTDATGSVNWERCALVVRRAKAIAWMRDSGVERVDRMTHEAALGEAHAEFDARHEAYIADLTARNAQIGAT